jgi:hypothetical protein
MEIYCPERYGILVGYPSPSHTIPLIVHDSDLDPTPSHRTSFRAVSKDQEILIDLIPLASLDNAIAFQNLMSIMERSRSH